MRSGDLQSMVLKDWLFHIEEDTKNPAQETHRLPPKETVGGLLAAVYSYCPMRTFSRHEGRHLSGWKCYTSKRHCGAKQFRDRYGRYFALQIATSAPNNDATF
jgi:CRISPR-associated Cas5-like protein